MPATFNDAWLFANVTDMRGDADRWAYSPEFDTLFVRYRDECDRKADRCLLFRHLVQLRKKRHVSKGAKLPEAKADAPTPELSDTQQTRLIDLCDACQRSGTKLAYTDELDWIADEMNVQWPYLRKYDLWLALDTLRKNGRLARKGRGTSNAGRRGFGAGK